MATISKSKKSRFLLFLNSDKKRLFAWPILSKTKCDLMILFNNMTYSLNL